MQYTSQREEKNCSQFSCVFTLRLLSNSLLDKKKLHVAPLEYQSVCPAVIWKLEN